MILKYLQSVVSFRGRFPGIAWRILPYIACGLLIELALLARPLAAAFGKGLSLGITLPLMIGLALLALRIGRGSGGRTVMLLLMELHAGVVIPLSLFVLLTDPSLGGAFRLGFALVEVFCIIVVSRDETVLNS